MQSTIDSSNRQIKKVLRLTSDQNMVRHKLNQIVMDCIDVDMKRIHESPAPKAQQ